MVREEFPPHEMLHLSTGVTPLDAPDESFRTRLIPKACVSCFKKSRVRKRSELGPTSATERSNRARNWELFTDLGLSIRSWSPLLYGKHCPSADIAFPDRVLQPGVSQLANIYRQQISFFKKGRYFALLYRKSLQEHRGNRRSHETRLPNCNYRVLVSLSRRKKDRL